MKKILNIIGIASFFLLSSCESDITTLNVDPKNPLVVDASNIFGSAQERLFSLEASSSVNLNPTRFFTQQWTQTTYIDESNYDLVTRQINTNYFNRLYNILETFENARVTLNNNTTMSADEKKNKLAQVELLSVYTWQMLVDTYGDVPYSEALKATDDSNKYLYPKYDDALTIYKDLIKRVDASLGTVNVSKSGFDKDFMYSGNMGLWKKFGNSLKLKLAMNLADVDPVLSKSTAESAFLGGVMTSQDQSAYCSYPGGLFPNPIYADVIQSGRKDYVASNTLVDAMKADNDPRLSKFFKPADGQTDIVGGEYGTNNDYYAFAHISDKVTAANAPAYILDYAEVSLLLAEAASRGYSVGDTAKNYYIQGVSASMDFWGVSSSDKAAYLAAHPYVSTDWKILIGKQSWYALYNRGHEAWTFNRRLDYPKFIPSGESVLSKVPTRMNYPATEQQINGANWKVAADKITGGDKATSKVFWDKF